MYGYLLLYSFLFPEGKYCGSTGLSNYTDLCAPGWYCIRGAWSDRPTDYGYNNISISCFCPSNATGGQCQEGEYCPRGSAEPIPCTPGKSITPLSTSPYIPQVSQLLPPLHQFLCTPGKSIITPSPPVPMYPR